LETVDILLSGKYWKVSDFPSYLEKKKNYKIPSALSSLGNIQ